MSHKLLLADDSITIQRVIELTFADEDVNVAAVGDGQQAIDRIEADPPDIILADVGMPKRDGYDVAAYVKSRPTLAHIPVVLLTGAFEPVDQARATAVGCDGVLAKPFEPHMVISRVKQLLKGAGSSSSPKPAQAAPPPAQPAVPTAATAEVKAPEVQPKATHDPDPVSLLTSDALAGKGKSPDAQVSLDDYFDQLDAAFSNLDASQRVGAPADRPAVAPQASPKDDLDWAPKRPTTFPELERPSGLARTPGAGPNEFEWIAEQAAKVSGPANLDFTGLTDAEPQPVERVEAPPVVIPQRETIAPPIAQQPTPVVQAPPIVHAAPVAHPQAQSAQPVVPRIEPPPVGAPIPGPSVAAPVQSAPKRQVSFDEPPHSAAEPPRPVVSVPMADAFVALLAAEQGETLAIPGVFAPPPAAGPIAITDELVERVSDRVLHRLNDAAVRDTVRDTVSRVAERLVREEIERIKRTGRLGD
ncbi:MAG TPA: response regulator [Vicinamibacterales bacterium]